jgi:hypothetical protein
MKVSYKGRGAGELPDQVQQESPTYEDEGESKVL